MPNPDHPRYDSVVELSRAIRDDKIKEAVFETDNTNDAARTRDVKALAVLLETPSSLTRLDLRINPGPKDQYTGDATLQTLSAALSNNTSLQRFAMIGGGVGDDGAKILAHVLEKNTTLRDVCLRNDPPSPFYRMQNHIGDEGARELAVVLTTHPSMRSIDLERNKIGLVGIEYLNHALNNHERLIINHGPSKGNNTDRARIIADINEVTAQSAETSRQEITAAVDKLFGKGNVTTSFNLDNIALTRQATCPVSTAVIATKMEELGIALHHPVNKTESDKLERPSSQPTYLRIAHDSKHLWPTALSLSIIAETLNDAVKKSPNIQRQNLRTETAHSVGLNRS